MAAVSGPSAYAFNDTYARRAGFNEHAATNRIIVVYPQLRFGIRARGAAQADECWDQSGQSGDAYSDKGGAQIAAVHRMVRRLLQPAGREAQRVAEGSPPWRTVLSQADARTARAMMATLVDWIMTLDVGSGEVKNYDRAKNPLNHSIFIKYAARIQTPAC